MRLFYEGPKLSSKGGLPNGGYTAEGLIEGDRIEGEGIVSGEGSSSFDVIINPEAIRIMRGDSDVTGSYNIRVENGYVTVNPYVAPTLQPLTIRGITATVDATSEGQTFSANQIAADGLQTAIRRSVSWKEIRLSITAS